MRASKLFSFKGIFHKHKKLFSVIIYDVQNVFDFLFWKIYWRNPATKWFLFLLTSIVQIKDRMEVNGNRKSMDTQICQSIFFCVTKYISGNQNSLVISTGSQRELKLFGYQHYSKYLNLCSYRIEVNGN